MFGAGSAGGRIEAEGDALPGVEERVRAGKVQHEAPHGHDDGDPNLEQPLAESAPVRVRRRFERREASAPA
jgi:hypothetical protein